MFFTETGTRNFYDKNFLLLVVRHAMIFAKPSYKKDCGMYTAAFPEKPKIVYAIENPYAFCFSARLIAQRIPSREATTIPL